MINVFVKKIFNKLIPFRIVFDREIRLGNFLTRVTPNYSTSLNKEHEARNAIFSVKGSGLKFLDVGARNGQLQYLLSITGNFELDEVMGKKLKIEFDKKYTYYGMDLIPNANEQILVGDICGNDYLSKHAQYTNFFDVIYSNNVFEHLKKPWIAAENIWKMLKTGGICITIVPFSQRYHDSPGDYFRYTHTGVESLFEDLGQFKVLKSGYDLLGRRNNWQGSGENNDMVPVDQFGAWRETWFTVVILQKL